LHLASVHTVQGSHHSALKDCRLGNNAKLFKQQCLRIIAELMQVDQGAAAGNDVYIIAGDFNLPKVAVVNTIETVVPAGFQVLGGEKQDFVIRLGARGALMPMIPYTFRGADGHSPVLASLYCGIVNTPASPRGESFVNRHAAEEIIADIRTAAKDEMLKEEEALMDAMDEEASAGEAGAEAASSNMGVGAPPVLTGPAFFALGCDDSPTSYDSVENVPMTPVGCLSGRTASSCSSEPLPPSQADALASRQGEPFAASQADARAPPQGEPLAPSQHDVPAAPRGEPLAPMQDNVPAPPQDEPLAPSERNVPAPLQGESLAPLQDDALAPPQGDIAQQKEYQESRARKGLPARSYAQLTGEIWSVNPVIVSVSLLTAAISFRREVTSRHGFPFKKCYIPKEPNMQAAIRRNMKDWFLREAADKRANYAAYMCRDVLQRTTRSLYKNFIVQVFGKEWFFDLFVAFGHVDAEMVQYTNEECAARKGAPLDLAPPQVDVSRLSNRGRAAVRDVDLPDVTGIQHRRSANYDARQVAKRARNAAEELQVTYDQESDEIASGVRSSWDRSVTWEDKRQAWYHSQAIENLLCSAGRFKYISIRVLASPQGYGCREFSSTRSLQQNTKDATKTKMQNMRDLQTMTVQTMQHVQQL
jgi:hypothetical protein